MFFCVPLASSDALETLALCCSWYRPSNRLGWAGPSVSHFPLDTLAARQVSRAVLWPRGSPGIGASSHRSLIPVPAQRRVAGQLRWWSPGRGSGTGVLPASSRAVGKGTTWGLSGRASLLPPPRCTGPGTWHAAQTELRGSPGDKASLWHSPCRTLFEVPPPIMNNTSITIFVVCP